ncbi:MAG TPA: hypothetical protein VKT32_10600 [Chthonomonadaceae bacterium]|nr:hypothetical protein [Chthonomonadaceae bacterium]
MSMKALSSIYNTQASIAPKAISATTNGSGVDLAGAKDNLITILPGVWTDGTHTFSLQESSDNTTFTNVAAADQVGTLNPVSGSASAVIQNVSYIGKLRYIRVVDTVAGGTTGMLVAAYVTYKVYKQPNVAG